MKKTILIAAATIALSLSLNSIVSAGDIETTQRYSTLLEQNSVDIIDTEIQEPIARCPSGFGC
jgi:hypothetical protein